MDAARILNAVLTLIAVAIAILGCLLSDDDFTRLALLAAVAGVRVVLADIERRLN